MAGSLAENLKYINQYNPILCKRILDINAFSKAFEIAQNPNGEYNLLINKIPVHNTQAAENEAVEIYKKLPHNSPNSIHLIYGLGLGYLYDVFAQNTNSTIIVFEPDIELLRFVFEAVDFSENFKKTRTFIVTNIAEFEAIFQSIFRYKTKLSLSTLNYHIQYQSSVLNLVKEEVHKKFGLISHNYQFQVNKIYDFLAYIIKDIKLKTDADLITKYPNVLKDKPAIIVSAGPSLAQNIEILKKYKDNAVIFCVGTALKTLLKNGITPDFLNVIEKTNTSIHFNVPETKDMMLVAEAYTNQSTFNKEFKRKFVTASEETGATRWFLEKIGEPLINFETKGTVAYHALFTAKYLGCNPIILIGQDLAYSNGDCYAKGSEFEDLKCIFEEETQKYVIKPLNYEKFRDSYYHSQNDDVNNKDIWLRKALEKFNKDLVTVTGQNGEKLPTSAVYSLFIEYLKDFARRNNDKLTLINSSIGGAQIDGFEVKTLEKAITENANKALDKKELFKAFESRTHTNTEYIIQSLNTDKEYLKNLYQYFNKGIIYTEKLKKELTIIKAYTQKAEELVTKLSNLYVLVTNNYSNKSNFFGMISMKERCEIDYLMKEFDGQMTLEKAIEFSEAFSNYFVNIKRKMNFVIRELDNDINSLGT